MTVRQCADFLGVSDNVIYAAIKRHRTLTAYQLSPQTFRIRRSDFLAWVQSSKTT